MEMPTCRPKNRKYRMKLEIQHDFRYMNIESKKALRPVKTNYLPGIRSFRWHLFLYF